MDPKAPWESVLALQERFGIAFLMAGGGVQVATRLCESILMRWWKGHTKVLEETRIATNKAVGSAAVRIFGEGYPPQPSYP